MIMKNAPIPIGKLNNTSRILETITDHDIITEYSVAFLYEKSLKDHAKALIQIAHPDDREMLGKAAFDRWKGPFF